MVQVEKPVAVEQYHIRDTSTSTFAESMHG